MNAHTCTIAEGAFAGWLVVAVVAYRDVEPRYAVVEARDPVSRGSVHTVVALDALRLSEETGDA